MSGILPYDVLIWVALSLISFGVGVCVCFCRWRKSSASAIDHTSQKRRRSLPSEEQLVAKQTPTRSLLAEMDEVSDGDEGDDDLLGLRKRRVNLARAAGGVSQDHTSLPIETIEDRTCRGDQSSSADTKLSKPIQIGICFVCAWLICYLVTVVLFLILGAAGMGESFLFAPKKASECSSSCSYSTIDGTPGWVNENCCTYNEQLEGMHDVWLEGPQGVIHGYLMVNSSSDTNSHSSSSTPSPYIYLLYNHGSGSNIAAGYRLRRYEYLLSLGNIVIFVYDYYSYGKSAPGAAGSASAAGTQASAEAAAQWFSNFTLAFEREAQSHASNNTSNRLLGSASLGTESAPVAVPSKASLGLRYREGLAKITMMGRSMGGTMAIWLSNQEAAWDMNGLLIQSIFLNLDQLAKDYFPVAGWALGAVANSKYPAFDNEVNLNSGNKPVCRYHAHSPDDEWVTYAQAEELNAIPLKKADCSEFVQVESGTVHTQPFTSAERSSLRRWINARRLTKS